MKMPLNYTTTITIIRTKSIVHHTPSATHEPSIYVTVLHMNVIKALLLAASQLEWSTFRVCLEADFSNFSLAMPTGKSVWGTKPDGLEHIRTRLRNIFKKERNSYTKKS